MRLQGVDDHRRLHRPGGHPEDQPGAGGGPPGLQEEDPEPQSPPRPPGQDPRVRHSRVLSAQQGALCTAGCSLHSRVLCREMLTHSVHTVVQEDIVHVLYSVWGYEAGIQIYRYRLCS